MDLDSGVWGQPSGKSEHQKSSDLWVINREQYDAIGIAVIFNMRIDVGMAFHEEGRHLHSSHDSVSRLRLELKASLAKTSKQK